MRPYAPATCLILLPLTLFAATIHVPSDQPTIQAGIDAASVGDTVLVACGTYYEHDIQMQAGIVLRSATGNPDCVTIDANYIGRCLEIDALDPPPTIEGITFRNAVSGASGGAIFINRTSVTIQRCDFLTNRAQEESEERKGGAVFANSSNVSITGCRFVDNEAAVGGALYFTDNCDPVITQSEFVGNLASAG